MDKAKGDLSAVDAKSHSLRSAIWATRPLSAWIEIYGQGSPVPVTTWEELFRHMHATSRRKMGWEAPPIPNTFRQRQAYIKKFRVMPMSARGTAETVYASAQSVYKNIVDDSEVYFALASHETNLEIYHYAKRLVVEGGPQDVYTWAVRECNVYSIGQETPLSIVHLCVVYGRLDILRYLWGNVPTESLVTDQEVSLPAKDNDCVGKDHENAARTNKFRKEDALENNVFTTTILNYLVNSVDGAGGWKTPLHLAIDCHCTRMIEFLLDKGADPLQNIDTKNICATPLEYAISRHAIVCSLPSPDTVECVANTRPIAPRMLEFLLAYYAQRNDSSCKVENGRFPIDRVADWYVHYTCNTTQGVSVMFRPMIQTLIQYAACCDWALLLATVVRSYTKHKINNRYAYLWLDIIYELIQFIPSGGITIEHLTLLLTWTYCPVKWHECIVELYLRMRPELYTERDLRCLWVAFAHIPPSRTSCAALSNILSYVSCAFMSKSLRQYTHEILDRAVTTLVAAGQARYVDILFRYVTTYFSRQVYEETLQTICQHILVSSTDSLCPYETTTCAVIVWYASNNTRLPMELDQFSPCVIDLHTEMNARRDLVLTALKDIVLHEVKEYRLVLIIHQYYFDGVCRDNGEPMVYQSPPGP